MPGPDYPIALRPPDIGAYRAGNIGLDYVTSFDSGRPGPHVMLSAVVHGNELCGAIALDFLFRQNVRPRAGRLTLAFVNIDAYLAFDPDNPTASRFIDEDFNRLWNAETLDGPRDSVELRRARALRPLLDTVDLLLDIHSMQYDTPPLMMAGPAAKGRQLARAVGVPRIVVSDAGHAAGTRMRDYGAFVGADSARNALLVECGQHWAAGSARIAIETALRFLLHAGTIGPEFAAPHLSGDGPAAQRFIEVTGPVTIETHSFNFAQDYRGLEVVPKAGTVIGHDGGKPVPTPYDDCVLIMPSRRLRRGESAVRFGRYIEAP
jgi:predicted deacylase